MHFFESSPQNLYKNYCFVYVGIRAIKTSGTKDNRFSTLRDAMN